ncbi:MAG: hypothetical protein V4467_00630 [Patescibacteria group bacterium]
MIFKKFKIFLAFLTGVTYAMLSATTALAQGSQITGGGSGSQIAPIITNPLGSVNSIEAFIKLLLDTLFPIAALLSIFFLIYAGFLMVMAGGSEEKLSKAKNALLWTVIGVAVLLGAKVISTIICGTIQQLGTAGLTCPTR